MALAATDLVLRLSRVISDAGTNGGRSSNSSLAVSTELTPWDDVGPEELASGITQYRKSFWRVANDDDLPLSKAKRFLERPTAGDDRIHICRGTHDDIQSDITGGSPVWYGAAALNASVLSGGQSIAVVLEASAVTIFRDGELIRISNKATPTAESGTEEWKRISGVPTLNGSILTIHLDSTLANGYSNTNTVVSSCLEDTGIAGAVSGKVVLSSAGTFDETDIQVDAIGSSYEVVTLAFTSSTAFSASGDSLGSLGTGSISAPFAPTNIALGKPYFTIAPAAFGGTFANGDEIEFTVEPPELAQWERRVVPPNCGTLDGNSRRLVIARR